MDWMWGEGEHMRAFAPSTDAANVIYLEEHAELRGPGEKQHERAAARVTENVERHVQPRYARLAIHRASSHALRRPRPHLTVASVIPNGGWAARPLSLRFPHPRDHGAAPFARVDDR